MDKKMGTGKAIETSSTLRYLITRELDFQISKALGRFYDTTLSRTHSTESKIREDTITSKSFCSFNESDNVGENEHVRPLKTVTSRKYT